MELTLKKLSLTNFKGIKDLEIEFGDITTISGKNRCGKTTIGDAIFWLLFGKSQADRKDFEIKTLDKNGNEIPRIEHNVTGVFEKDGTPILLSRTLKEKWVKPQGKPDQVFTGNETLYSVNDVPVSQAEYQNTINNIIREDLFKLLTVTGYFNSIKWEERRAILTSIASIPTDEQIAGEEFKGILKLLNEQYKTVANLKKAYAKKKQALKKLLDEYPGRIDEAHKAMPQEKDFASIENQIKALQAQIENTEAQLSDSSKAVQQKANERTKILLAKNSIESKISDIVFKARQEFANSVGKKDNEILNLKQRIEGQKGQLDFFRKNLNTFDKPIAELTDENNELREEAYKVSAEQFNISDNDISCPTCSQLLPEDMAGKKREELLLSFNANKQKRLSGINATGVANKNRITELEKSKQSTISSIKELELQIGQMESMLTELQSTPSGVTSVEKILADNPEYGKLQEELKAIVVPELSEEVDNTELTSRRFELTRQIDALKAELNDREAIARQKARIKELEEEERIKAQELSEMEGIEYQAEQFNKRRITAVETSVNKLFPTVRWRMFDQQINGGESETCVCLINGVPYPDANTEGKINAGIEIINVFSHFHQITTPIIVDNAEAVGELVVPNGQLIALYHVAGQPMKIKVENKQKQVA